MLRYILTRFLLMIPLLAVVSLLAFLLSQGSPGDPVESMLQSQSEAENASGSMSRINHNEEVLKIRKRLGLDLPLFYLSIATRADVDTLYRVKEIQSRPVLKMMARETGHPDSVMVWFKNQLNLSSQIRKSLTDTIQPVTGIDRENLNRALSLNEGILVTVNYNDRSARIDSLANLLSLIPAVRNERSLFEKGIFTYRYLYSNCAVWKKYVPSLHFFGFHNQYHQWLFGNSDDKKGVIHGDFGVSYRDGSPVMAAIGKSVKWTLLLTLSAMILALLISIPVGLKAGANPGGLFDRITGFFAFSLYALPGFFVASMLLLFFANPDFLDWFPASGIKDPEVFNPTQSFVKRAIQYLPYLILPVVSLTYAQFAFITRQVRAGVIEAMQSDYVKAARSFGISENQILLKHVLPNILFPLITLIGQSLPLLFGGSVIIESIFSIPGMGLEMYQSVIALDYPMIVAIFTIIGFLTMIGYLLSDILYAIADPRVRHGKEAKT